MKTSPLPYFLSSLGAVLALSLATARSAPPGTSELAAQTSVTNSSLQSVFSISNASGPARDPFFPSRIMGAETVKSPDIVKPHPVGADCLALKGLSGPPGNRLAMINGRTMSRGEDAEIVTECGRLLVHCVDITTNSAFVEIAGQRQELHLRPDF